MIIREVAKMRGEQVDKQQYVLPAVHTAWAAGIHTKTPMFEMRFQKCDEAIKALTRIGGGLKQRSQRRWIQGSSTMSWVRVVSLEPVPNWITISLVVLRILFGSHNSVLSNIFSACCRSFN